MACCGRLTGEDCQVVLRQVAGSVDHAVHGNVSCASVRGWAVQPYMVVSGHALCTAWHITLCAVSMSALQCRPAPDD